MPLPATLRALVPDSIRHNARLRAAAVRRGLIPPMPMHTEAEAELLAELADGRSRAVEIGVFEGSSALVLVNALPPAATLHLIDPYAAADQLVADSERRLPEGDDRWRGTERAARAMLARAAAQRGGPRIDWRIARSEDAAAGWSEPLDFVFIDGDHSEGACHRDWDLWSPRVVAGGVVAFHDARAGKPGGWGGPGPTAVCDALFRGAGARAGWSIVGEVDTLVAVEHSTVA